MKRSLTRLCLTLLLAACATTLNATERSYYKNIFILCEDTHGAYLGRDTIRVPKDVCFFLLPPTIAHFTAADFDAKGTNVCIDNDAYLTMHYETNATTGFDTLTSAMVNTIAHDQSFVMMDALCNQPTLWKISPDHNSAHRAKLNAQGDTPEATWIFEKRENGWAIYNSFTFRYLAEIANDGTLRMSDVPTIFDLTSDSTTTSAHDQHPIWTLRDRHTEATISIRLRRFHALPYFSVYVRHLDNVGTELHPDSVFCFPADAPFTFTPPQLDGRNLLRTTSTTEMGDLVSDVVFVECYYDQPTSIVAKAVSSDENLRFNLTGHRVGTNYKGIVIEYKKKRLQR